MMRYLRATLWLLAATLLMACSGGEVGEGEHVWQEQERALERARESEQQMQDAFEQRQQEIQRQTGQGSSSQR